MARSRDDFLDVKWLDYIVVSAGFHAFDPFVPLPARGQDEHGNVALRLAPALQDGHAVNGRQAKIENDGIVGFGVATVPGDFPVMFDIDKQTSSLKRLAERGGYSGVVFSNEDAQLVQTKLTAGFGVIVETPQQTVGSQHLDLVNQNVTDGIQPGVDDARRRDLA